MADKLATTTDGLQSGDDTSGDTTQRDRETSPVVYVLPGAIEIGDDAKDPPTSPKDQSGQNSGILERFPPEILTRILLLAHQMVSHARTIWFKSLPGEKAWVVRRGRTPKVLHISQYCRDTLLRNGFFVNVQFPGHDMVKYPVYACPTVDDFALQLDTITAKCLEYGLFHWLPHTVKRKLRNLTVHVMDCDPWEDDTMLVQLARSIYWLGGISEVTWFSDEVVMVPLTSGHPSGRPRKTGGTLLVEFSFDNRIGVFWVDADYVEGTLELEAEEGWGFAIDLWDDVEYGGADEHISGQDLLKEWLARIERDVLTWTAPKVSTGREWSSWGTDRMRGYLRVPRGF